MGQDFSKMLLTLMYSPTMRENSAIWTGVNQCFQALSSTAYTAVKASEGILWVHWEPSTILVIFSSSFNISLILLISLTPVTTIHILSHSRECGLCFEFPVPVEDHILLAILLWISPVDFFLAKVSIGVWSV